MRPVPAPRTRDVLGAGVRLRVHEHGVVDAPTVVLVHGYPDTSALWDEVVPRLAVDHHVVTYDVRGAGRSERPRGRSAYALDLLVADLRAVVAATAPGRPVHLVGHDWGAVQGFAAVGSHAASAPPITSLTALSAPGLDVVGNWVRTTVRRPTPTAVRALADQARRSWYVVAFQVPVLPEVLWHAVLGPGWRRKARRRGTPRLASTLAADGAAGVQLYRANLRRLHRRHRFVAPVHVLTAARDPFVTPQVFDRLADHGDDVTIDVVPSGSHWLPRTHAEVVAAAVRTTVGRTSPS